MQTFLPFASFRASAAALDDVRLGKQRVETLQILRALTFPSYRGWRHHPATAMWRGFSAALVCYGLAVCAEWARRGRADAVASSLLQFVGGTAPTEPALRRAGRLPPWFGDARLHASHRACLARKLPEHYGPRLPDADPDLPYHWPRPVLPGWPMRTRKPLSAGRAELLVSDRKGDRIDQEFWRAVLTAPAPLVIVARGSRERRHPPAEALRPSGGVVRPGRLSPSIARAPTPADRRAMQRQAGETPWLFAFAADDWRRQRANRPDLAGATVLTYPE